MRRVGNKRNGDDRPGRPRLSGSACGSFSHRSDRLLEAFDCLDEAVELHFNLTESSIVVVQTLSHLGLGPASYRLRTLELLDRLENPVEFLTSHSRGLLAHRVFKVEAFVDENVVR